MEFPMHDVTRLSLRNKQPTILYVLVEGFLFQIITFKTSK